MSAIVADCEGWNYSNLAKLLFRSRFIRPTDIWWNDLRWYTCGPLMRYQATHWARLVSRGKRRMEERMWRGRYVDSVTSLDGDHFRPSSSTQCSRRLHDYREDRRLAERCVWSQSLCVWPPTRPPSHPGRQPSPYGTTRLDAWSLDRTTMSSWLPRHAWLQLQVRVATWMVHGWQCIAAWNRSYVKAGQHCLVDSDDQGQRTYRKRNDTNMV